MSGLEQAARLIGHDGGVSFVQIHLDPIGGWSGDMFVAALLDTFPTLRGEVDAAIGALDLGSAAACRLVAHDDGTLTGSRFVVAADEPPAASEPHHHDHSHGHSHDHGHHDHRDGTRSGHGAHRAWADIRALLHAAPLPAAVRTHAIGIFTLLARAEARVHGVNEDAVTFHEVGAVDSIVDIVAAAQLVACLNASRWTAAPLPLGSGRVRTAHGMLPVPAPATAILLEGLQTIDDGVAGERVTPTGAAVARYLLHAASTTVSQPRRLTATGTGFGTRSLPGLSNCLRVLAFDETAPAGGAQSSSGISHRDLGVISFEVDDQSAEDLTHGLDHIRSMPGIHDVVQSVVFGKKGRMATHVQVLVAPEQLDAAITACFEETTTIGLRHHLVHGAVLPRGFDQVEIGAHRLRVKTVVRPGGARTGKTEASDVADHRGHAARVALRRAGEAAVLSRREGQGGTEPGADQ